MTAVQLRKAVITTSVIGAGTFLFYKMVVPSPDKDADRKAKSAVHQIDMDENQPKGPGAGSAIGSDTNSRNFARVIELSQQGYSYETITKIIGNEQKRRYQALYAREEYERKQWLEAERAAKKSGLTLPTIDITDVIESAVEAIAFSPPASKT